MASASIDEVLIGWFDNPANTSWQRDGDAIHPIRHAPVVQALVKRFGKWEEAARAIPSTA
jgi:hypothetical protein